LLPTNNKTGESSGNSRETGPHRSLSEFTNEQALEIAFSDYDSGRLPQAEKLCRLILQEIPQQVDAMQLLGTILSETGRYAEAAQILQEVIRQAPGHAHLHNNLGMTFHRLDKLNQAISQFRKALEIRPDFEKALNNLGVTLMKLGRIEETVTACNKAIRLKGDFKEAYNNLGLALKKKGELEKAVTSYEKAIALDGEYAEALSNLGITLIAQGRLSEAEHNLQKAVRLVPNSAEFHNNLGSLFNHQGRFEDAIASSKKATGIRPDYVEAHNNLGTALMELGWLSEANVAFERAIVIDPGCAEAHHNRALVLLLTGQFDEGWEEYEWRWKHGGFSTPLRPFSQEWWGNSVQDVAKLLVWGEQGIGDEVQFSGLIRHIMSRSIDVVVECDRRLVGLLKRSLPGIAVVERTEPPAVLLKDASITHQIPMGSLPRLLSLSPNSMPPQVPFLKPDIEKREQLRYEYKGRGDPVLVGISWRSGNKQEGRKRSVQLEHWGPILKVEAVKFVSLQYGDCSRNLRDARDRFGVDILKDERINPLEDLENFAAQVAAMDLVISVDNSTVHFAGALGIKVWTMLPAVPDWRWGLEGDRTRWYQAMRLFRQEERGNWEPVVSRAAEELTSLIKRRKVSSSTLQ
jgi:Flp pilus assembly protein TadD